jgi:hypothetical protein
MGSSHRRLYHRVSPPHTCIVVFLTAKKCGGEACAAEGCPDGNRIPRTTTLEQQPQRICVYARGNMTSLVMESLFPFCGLCGLG